MAIAHIKKQKPFKRAHGVLMPIFSLNSPYGIGTLGKPAKDFVDFIALADGTYWQVLPLGPTGYGDSPYQCFSAFAGNPYFLDPEGLFNEGWLKKDELDAFKSENSGRIDYLKLYKTRKKLLFNAYLGFLKNKTSKHAEKMDEFFSKTEFWLDDYVAFMSIKNHFNMCGRQDFKKFSIKTDEAVQFSSNTLSEEKNFLIFLEFAFWLEWSELKSYATQKGVRLIGDIPLYVSNDSSDVWAHPELFVLDSFGNPTQVAGVPPDMFSQNGQLWGNPLYNWQKHKNADFNWWMERIKWQAELFDIIRIDHFIGICRYYKIDANAKTAKNGVWCKGPDKELISAITKACPDVKFIAEDLGMVTKEVKSLINRSGFPGMRLMQFGFDGTDNPNSPHNINNNSVVYTGTHDNQTLLGFLSTCPTESLDFMQKYMNVMHEKDLPLSIIKECFRSPANTAIIPYHDYLMLDDDARINTPSTTGNNWCWRTTHTPSKELAKEIAALAAIYQRKREN